MKTKSSNQIKKHHGHDDLIGEHKWGDTGQIVCLVVFLAIWVSDSFILNYSTGIASGIPLFIRVIVGLLILSYSWWLAKSGLKIVFGEKREKPEVINKGVFSKVRHPIYLGAILLYLGLIFITFSLSSFLFWLIIIIPFYILISRYEEKILMEYFGEDYLEYKKRVPMLFPYQFRNGFK